MAQAQRTVLQMVQQVQQELGLPISTTVFGNSDVTTVQMLSFLQLANEELREFNDDGWVVLQTEFNLVVNPPLITTGIGTENSAVITNIPNTAALSPNYWTVQGPYIPQAARILSVDSPTQITMTMEATGSFVAADSNLVFAQDTYAMPPDFRFFIGDTWWDRTNRWQLLGPDSPQLDQWHRSGVVATGPRRHFRQLGPLANNYRLWPPPAEIVEPLQLSYEYLSLYTVSVNGSQTVFAEQFVNDNDQPLLDARALMLAMKWRFWEQKGLNYAAKRDEYDRYVDRLMSRDGGSNIVSLTPRSYPYYLSPLNVQDGFFPGPGNNNPI